ncbi:bifunctional nicotinamidase/pyrazinamidase [Nannocystis sp.]|uniref:bifunctional nicotinamidase/pyrazinamidase n=1 Tax=Nannocystis sp. TaxID=1962667 RepID=UPI002425AC08|nr:bifunctional nicotinamidase/pyrazinamidase [Nannocystis sp.]MBK7825832.1 bifunctional nicotinamidase/pyrazinamidase [Nannocystis sp.]MBK9755629.1 bifunctional nicotinamidase/pyrazinamidase [Nannocystis sp.]
MGALIVVDIQNDFLPGGALAVPRGDEVVAVANSLMPRFRRVVATQDWHPAGHKSFAASHPGRSPGELITLAGAAQVLWPVHCVQGTRGAAFAAELQAERVDAVVHKGMDPEIDSYSGFFDNDHRRATGLEDRLRALGESELWVLGLATDYCVKATALDAVRLGFRTSLVVDGCRAVELQAGDGARAIAEMQAAGVTLVTSGELLAGGSAGR